MKNEIDIFKCPFLEECDEAEERTQYYYDNEVTETFQVPKCKMPVLVFKSSGDPICRLTFDPDAPDADLNKYAKTIREHVKMYKKPLLDRIRDFFGGVHDEQ